MLFHFHNKSVYDLNEFVRQCCTGPLTIKNSKGGDSYQCQISDNLDRDIVPLKHMIWQ